MDESDSVASKLQDENIKQINKENIRMDNNTKSTIIFELDDETKTVTITDQNFNEIQNFVDKQTMKESLETTPSYENICFNSFVMDYNDDDSEFASTFYVENSFQTATLIDDDQHMKQSQIDQIDLIRTILNNVIDNAITKCERNNKKMNSNFLQVEEVFPLSNWRVRRTSSLKQLNSTDDPNNTTKKIVRFADSLGLDLIDVRTYIDEMPRIPLSAYQDLSRANCSKHPNEEEFVWLRSFEQPEGLPNFRERLSRNFVNLQSATFIVEKNCIQGRVVVENIDFKKLVQVRMTTNNWRTYSDWDCTFVESSCDGFVDTFQFDIAIGDISQEVHSKIEFAIKFRCKDHEFWDNNFGQNYIYELVRNITESTENDEKVEDTCSAAFYCNNLEDAEDINLRNTLVQNYMSKLLQRNGSSNQQTYQKEIRNSERTLEVFIITGILVMCAIFFYIEKVIYFV